MAYFSNDECSVEGKRISVYTEYNEDIETGYVTDSSLSSRLGTKSKTEQAYSRQLVNRRKTKSERDKRRSSRISSIDAIDSHSENSSLEQSPLRYRKRINNKRLEEGSKDTNLETKSGKRVDNKLPAQHNPIENNKETNKKPYTNTDNFYSSTATIKMNKKDIYYGTWNPKERAVLDQIIKNVEFNKGEKKTLKDFLLRREAKLKKDKSAMTDVKEKSLFQNQFCNEKTEKKKTILSGFLKLKVWKEKEKNSFAVLQENPLQDVYDRIKKGLLNRFSRKKDFDVPRRRAQSANDYSTIQTQSQLKNGNLWKNRFGSSSSLKNIFHQTKSIDDLQGAFEYFANQKQVFQRTSSAANLDKISPSLTRLNNNKINGSNMSLNHRFEPTQTKDDFSGEKLVVAQPSITQPAVANHRSLRLSNSIGQYDSAYEDSFSSREYQSDRPLSSACTGNKRYPKQANGSDCKSARSLYSTSDYRLCNPPYIPSPNINRVHKQPSSATVFPKNFLDSVDIQTRPVTPKSFELINSPKSSQPNKLSLKKKNLSTENESLSIENVNLSTGKHTKTNTLYCSESNVRENLSSVDIFDQIKCNKNKFEPSQLYKLSTLL